MQGTLKFNKSNVAKAKKAYDQYDAEYQTVHSRLTFIKKVLDQQHPIAKTSPYYKTALSLDRKLKQLRAKRNRYQRAKNKDELKMYRQNTIINKNAEMGTTDKYNAYIMPNHPNSNDSYILMQVQTQGDDHSTNAASTPVEHGMNVITTSQMSAPQISVSAMISADIESIPQRNAEKVMQRAMHQVKQQANRLQHWSHEGTDMFWSGIHTYDHCIITDCSVSYNWGPDGSINTANVSLVLTVANYFGSKAKTKRGAKNKVGSKGRTPGRSSKLKNPKHYVIAKSGMTYDYIAEKKGVSVQSLEQKNSYESRKIPIGSKIYY